MKKRCFFLATVLLCTMMAATGFSACDWLPGFSSSVESSDYGTAIATFEGSAEKNGTVYNVEMKLMEDLSFVLEANDIDPIKGTYTYADEVGYTFTFDDGRETVRETEYDRETQEHFFDYGINLNASGYLTVTLKYKDTEFTLPPESEVPEEMKAVFNGRWVYTGSFADEISLTCSPDGTCVARTEAANKTVRGTYTFVDGVYNFKLNDVYGTDTNSTYDSETNTYTVSFQIDIGGATANAMVTYTPGSSSEGGDDPVTPPEGGDDPVTPPEQKEVADVFNGVFTIGGGQLVLDAKMECYIDNTFKLTVAGRPAGKIVEEQAGTYSVAGGVYTFDFENEAIANITTSEDAQTGAQVFTYSFNYMNMVTVEGQLLQKAVVDVFSGVFTIGGGQLVLDAKMECYTDNTFKLTVAGRPAGKVVEEQAGTYSVTDGVYIFDFENEAIANITTSEDAQTGAQVFTYSFNYMNMVTVEGQLSLETKAE